MREEAIITMLPTKENGALSKCLKTYTEEGTYNKNSLRVEVDGHEDWWEHQHLYMTVPQNVDPIKVGDWTLDLDCGLTHGRLTRIDNEHELTRYAHNPKYNIRKIIATTDEKLTIDCLLDTCPHEWKCSKSCFNSRHLPGMAQSLIEEYCLKAKTTIYTVLVEYKNRCCGRCDGVNGLCFTDMTCKLHSIEGCEKCWGETGDILKLTQDADVKWFPMDIKRYSREEVMDLLMDALFEPTPYNTNEAMDWIKEKL